LRTPFVRILLAGALVAASLLPEAHPAPAVTRTYPLRILSGWSPYWNPDSGPAGITAMGSLASSASSFSYSVYSATSIGRKTSLDRYGKMRAAARAARIPFVPALADATSKLKMAGIVTDPVLRALHVKTLVDFAVEMDFDGLDLDYEGFAYVDGGASWATTKPGWTQFVIDLADALHAKAKLLFVTVPPTYNNNQTRGSGYWVYNLPGIAPHVDRIRIMAYDYSSSTMGPTAPLYWTQKIVDYVVANLPVSKVELGVPLYGRDWISGVSGTCPAGTKTSGKSALRAVNAAKLVKAKNAKPVRMSYGEMKFTYTVPVYAPTSSTTTTSTTTTDVDVTDPITTDPSATDPANTDPASSSTSSTTVPTTNPPLCTITHTVYYPDAQTTVLKVQQALAKGLAGVVFFALGYEEAKHFSGLRSAALAVPHARGADPIGRWSINAVYPGQVSVSGWALDPETSLPIVVRVVVDGKVRQHLLANDRRDDVGSRYVGNGPYHGASTLLSLKAGRHNVCVQAIGVGAGRSTKTLTCRVIRVRGTSPTTTTTTTTTTTSTTSTTTSTTSTTTTTVAS